MTYRTGFIAILACIASATAANADKMIFESFDEAPDARWEYIADGVMGGVSKGQADFVADGDRNFVRLTGNVSTDFNGGFIQVRRLFPEAFPEQTDGVSIDARGNGEVYYLFIRTKQMTRPWYYYSVPISPQASWSKLDIPLGDFERSHAHLDEVIDPADVVSLGVVAYGRDHDADISVSEMSFF